MDVASLVERSESPAKPKDDAAEPCEMAHSVKDCNSVQVPAITKLQEHKAREPDVLNEPPDTNIEPQKMDSDKKEEGESAESGISDSSFLPQNGILTESMIEEEKQLHQHTMEEEQKMKEERTVAINSMDEDMKEQRYKRLQFLLSKSNMYTSYLIERMKRQAEEESKRKERLAKKQAREAEKIPTEVDDKESEKTPTEQEASNKTDASSDGDKSQEKIVAMETASATEACASNDEHSKETSVSMETDKPAVQNDSPRSRRSSRLRKAESENDSQCSQDSQEKDKTDAAAKKRGQKRKASASNVENYKISDYFQEALSRSKRHKVDGEQKPEATDKKETSDKASVVDENKPDNHTVVVEKPSVGKEQETAEEPAVGKRSYKGEEIPELQPTLFTGGVLRPYQIQGFQWLKILYENGVNGILADEMGLGKTIQCIATIAHLAYNGVPGPFLVCAPLSTVPNWMSEFQRFAPKVPVILYHGQRDERERLRRKISKRHLVRKGVEVQPVVITSYEICMNDRKYMANYEWRYLIVDEGHRIKNFQCKLIRELKMYRSTNRLLLTGTPLQNNLSELWSLLNFLLPEIFDDLGSFESWFDIDCLESDDVDEQIVQEEQRKNILCMLHQILTPFLLRRLKSDVELVIPPKREVVVYAPLTKLQENYYRSAVDKTINNLVTGGKDEKEEKVEIDTKGRPTRRAAKNVNTKYLQEMMSSDKDEKDDDEEEIEKWISTMAEQQALKEKEMNSQTAYKVNYGPQTVERNIKLTNIMMLLRKTCSHPYLLEYPLTEAGEYKIDENLIKASGKTLLLDRMLPELKKRGHKVLLFSQMTKLLDILEDYCQIKKYKFSRLDGSMKVEDRRDQMEQFNTDPDVFIFLLSTRAGGLGINLVAADTVIIYDSDWNPQSDLQAQDRCHRIGQNRPVVVYRLVTANTIDQKIVERAAAKRKLEKMVIHRGKFKSGMANFSTSMAPISPQELLELLKSVDYDEAIGARDKSVISAKDLNRLLDRSDLLIRWKEQLETKRKEGLESSKKTSKKAATTQVKGVFEVISEEDGKTGLESNVNITGTVFDAPKASGFANTD